MFLNMDLGLRIKSDILYYPKATKPSYSYQYLLICLQDHPKYNCGYRNGWLFYI